MKYFLKYFSCLMVFFVLSFLPFFSSAYFRPIPYQTAPITETPLDGIICVIHELFWGYGGEFCLTATERQEVEADPNRWIAETAGPCKKCSSDAYHLTEVNGVETCLHRPPCPEDPVLGPYTYGNYDGTDGCYLCPKNYEFSQGDCQWVGTGPPPPEPIPDRPSFLRASDGENFKNIAVTWEKVEGVDYYYLERRSGGQTTWVGLGRRGVNYYDDGPDTENLLAPSAGIGKPYFYRVQSCNSERFCSNYSNEDRGYIALKKPKIVLLPYPDDKSKLAIGWFPVPGALWYDIYRAKDQKYYSSYQKEEFRYVTKVDKPHHGINVYTYISPDKHALAVQACTDFVCSEFDVYNLNTCPMEAIIDLLLKGKE